MPDETYKLPENPAYRAGQVRRLRDTDLADACQTFNPLVEAVLESVEYLNRNKAALNEGGKVPEEQLPEMDYVPNSEKAKAGGVATLNEKGKVPSGQLPAMNYVPTSQKGSANGVASLDASGKVPEGQLPVLGGHTAQATAPGNTNLLWIDTANGNILKFYDASSKTWKPVGAVWS